MREDRGGLTLGSLLAERLHARGVRRAFGFPGGGSNLDLFEDFEDAGIDWTLTHTENAAAFMACAGAEVERVPGVVVVGNGPGLASVVDGAAHAWLDRVPLLVVSDRYTEGEAATTGHQVVDQRALLAPVVKAGLTLEAEGAAEAIDELLDTALAFPQGPVHIDMARTAAAEPYAGAAPAAGGEPAGAGAATGAAASTGTDAIADPDRAARLDAFAAALAAAEHPVFLVGLEANEGVEPEELRALAEATGAAVFVTYKAKGAYPERDGRWAGILTGGVIERPLLERADLFLAVGLDAVELLAKPWPYGARVLSLSEGRGADGYLAPAERLVGGLAAAVAELAERTAAAPEPGFTEAEVGEFREGALASLRLDPEQPLPGWRIVELVDEALPEAATIAVDAGSHMFPATNFARPAGPNRFLISNGLATMGFALPAALGAALARPGEPSVALTGDGGMAYHSHELETAVRLGSRLVVVVFNDSSLSLIRIKQEAKGFTRRPLDFGPTDFAALAGALGAAGEVVEDAAALRAALAAALKRSGPSVIDARTTGAESARTLQVIRG
jgi:acetolactate synthase-1/2/3 large subunit